MIVRILFDLSHPAHVHFFKQPMILLAAKNHDLFVTSRKKDVTLSLLEELNISHSSLSSQINGNIFVAINELIRRNYRLLQVVNEFKPDVMVAIGGTFIAHVGFVTRRPSLVFYDTENAKLQNLITYPFASYVYVPRCYESWTPKNRTKRYAGYHELSYLHPRYFQPNQEIAVNNGLDPWQDNFFIRLVSWEASHDIGEHCWDVDILTNLISKLSALGKVIISSEAFLPERFKEFVYQGNVSEIHHVMAFSRAFIGESATMASECACLGVPGVYAAQTGRGYMQEQESRYKLITHVRELKWLPIQQAIDNILSYPAEFWRQQREKLLQDTIDVAQYVVDTIENIVE